MSSFSHSLQSLLAIVVLIVLLGLPAILRGGGRSWLSRILRKPLMTENEREFFLRLQRALPAHWVFPQVAFAAFLTDDGKLSRQKRWSVRARFDRKIADFVVCDRQSPNIVAIVELDDRTHTAHADQRRDAITGEAGYRTFRFQSKRKPTEAEITALFQEFAATVSNTRPPTRPSQRVEPRLTHFQ